jgi:hypothetical protein
MEDKNQERLLIKQFDGVRVSVEIPDGYTPTQMDVRHWEGQILNLAKGIQRYIDSCLKAQRLLKDRDNLKPRTETAFIPKP